jgi:hypothetical protein
MVQVIKGEVPVNAVKAYGGSRGAAPHFLNLILVAEEWSASCPGRCTTRERTLTYLPMFTIMPLNLLQGFVSSGIVPAV